MHHGIMLRLVSAVIYSGLFQCALSQFVTIWSNNMNTQQGWVGHNDHDFGYDSANCPGATDSLCAVVRANNGS